MSYQVLARKWRPRSFAEVIGQAHVLKALINALDTGRLHHAYLFTGTRGVGKTTLARVLAKALNCEVGVSSQPCGVCGACQEIDQGRFVDLIEVDAASRTKVDETRELLDNVQYAPTRARYKVYLIDEVHMFSNHSFNALLKTLEEPPPHVKFLLATTDPKKLPVTILSRCLQFNLTRMPASLLAKHLAHVLTEEGVAFDEGALALIAQAAGGSVRDSLSLLDQAIAHGAGRVSTDEVVLMLGTVDQDRVVKVLAQVAAGDGHAVIGAARELAAYVPDYGQVLAEMASLLRRVAVLQVLGGEGGTLETDPRLADLAARLPADEVQLLYQIALTGRRDLAMSPDAEAAFEMTLLRMLAFRPVTPGSLPKQGLAGQAGATSTPRVTAAAPLQMPRETPRQVSTPVAAPPAVPDASTLPATPALPASVPQPTSVAPPSPQAGRRALTAPPANFDWAQVVEELNVVGLARELARNSAVAAFDGRRLDLVITPQYEKLAQRRHVDTLQAALAEKLEAEVVVNVSVSEDSGLTTPSQQQLAAAAERQRRAEAEIDADPNVQALRSAFGATIEEVSSR
ncbi:MAG: DNA polymerase III subunit gamma/tau [Gammaproteobacteria bacterium]